MKERKNIFKEIKTEKKLPDEAKEELLSILESIKLNPEKKDLSGNTVFSKIKKLFRTKS